MRELTGPEIWKIVRNLKWATICTVTPDGLPYAIEATYFVDGQHIGFMINPRGRTMRNLQICSEVVLKVTHVEDDLARWAGISLFGTGRQMNGREVIMKGWALLGGVMGMDYSEFAHKYADSSIASPLLTCEIQRSTGRCSSGYLVPELSEQGMGKVQSI